MKLLQDASSAHHTVTGYGAHHLIIDQTRFEHSLIVMPDQILPWTLAWSALAEADWSWATEARVEVVLLGTGARQRFPAPEVLRAWAKARRAVEVMDTAAACRTYNILVSEGRRAAAVLLLD